MSPQRQHILRVLTTKLQMERSPNIYAGSQRIALRTNGTLNYLLGDHLGSTSLTTSATGTVISEMRYKDWGETRYSSGTTPTKYTYTGQYSYASDFGLHFYNARWYDSSLGRFAQADTIIPEQSQGVQAWDRYAYVNNSPLKYTDPTGHCGEGSIPGEGISADHHEWLCQLREDVLEISARVAAGEITDDVEGLAQVTELAAPHYQQSFNLFGRTIVYSEDKKDFARDLGLVVGGNVIYPDPVMRMIRDRPPRDELFAHQCTSAASSQCQYYVECGAFGASGFAEDLREENENQVRHFAGGLSAAGHSAFARWSVLRRERDNPDDYRLHQRAFELFDLNLRLDRWGDWIREHLAEY